MPNREALKPAIVPNIPEFQVENIVDHQHEYDANGKVTDTFYKVKFFRSVIHIILIKGKIGGTIRVT